jgi:transcriptional regulator with XRE-family HTH domain
MRNDRAKSIGDYNREQREQARISVRQLAQTAGVSNPYLSQIERGLRKPSADILQQLAKGLRISAEALYVQAGILDDRPADSGVRSALLADPELSERQKQVLMEIYESFRKENSAAAEVAPGPAVPAEAPFAAGAGDDAEIAGDPWAVAAFTAEQAAAEEASADRAAAAQAAAGQAAGGEPSDTDVPDAEPGDGFSGPAAPPVR